MKTTITAAALAAGLLFLGGGSYLANWFAGFGTWEGAAIATSIGLATTFGLYGGQIAFRQLTRGGE
jgi:hypothetical protein